MSWKDKMMLKMMSNKLVIKMMSNSIVIKILTIETQVIMRVVSLFSRKKVQTDQVQP